jgi:uncharacterized phage-associated protein
MGAVPIGHNSIIDLKNVPCEEIDLGETNAYHFSLAEEHLFPSLNDEDKKILDTIIEKLGKMSKNEIISFMHQEQAYKATPPGDIIQVKRTFAIRFRYLLMNAVALRTVSGSF